MNLQAHPSGLKAFLHLKLNWERFDVRPPEAWRRREPKATCSYKYYSSIRKWNWCFLYIVHTNHTQQPPMKSPSRVGEQLIIKWLKFLNALVQPRYGELKYGIPKSQLVIPFSKILRAGNVRLSPNKQEMYTRVSQIFGAFYPLLFKFYLINERKLVRPS